MPTLIEEKHTYFYEFYIEDYYTCLPIKFIQKEKNALKLIPKINEPMINDEMFFDVKSIKFKDIVDSLVLNDLYPIESINNFTFKNNGMKKENYFEDELYNYNDFFNRNQIIELIRQLGLFESMFPSDLKIIF
jgi:hypothetical protein